MRWSASRRLSWFVRLVANDLSLRERREYLAWLKASALHVEALLDIYRYHGYGRKGEIERAHLHRSGSRRERHSIFAARWQQCRAGPRSRGETAAAGHDQSRGGPGRRHVSLFVVGLTVKASYFDKRFATGPGEWDQTLLADGSVLRIGPNTRLRWSFYDSQRTIVLSRGEAVFEVAKDPQRPFIVTTRVGDVRAVGTEFGVSLMNASTAVVTVAHGKVAVSKPSNGRFLVNDMSGHGGGPGRR